MAGPMMRATVISVELRATALTTSSGGTRSLTRVRRAGLSKVLARPSDGGEHVDDADGDPVGERRGRPSAAAATIITVRGDAS